MKVCCKNRVCMVVVIDNIYFIEYFFESVFFYLKYVIVYVYVYGRLNNFMFCFLFDLINYN